MCGASAKETPYRKHNTKVFKTPHYFLFDTIMFRI